MQRRIPLWGSHVRTFKDRLHGLPFSTFFECLSKVVTSGPMLSLCADWLAVLARQPDEIALMESFLSKAAEHHVHVPAFVIQWAIWWNSTLRGAYDWDCPALFSSMEQWVTIREPPLAPSPWFKCCQRNTCTRAYGSAAAAASAPALVSSCVLCIAVSISSYWRWTCPHD